MVTRRRPVVLCVLDGFGERDADAANAITTAKTPRLDALKKASRFTTLAASGEAIGVAEHSPGRGDLGYATLGAGRVIPSLRATVAATAEQPCRSRRARRLLRDRPRLRRRKPSAAANFRCSQR